MMLVQDDVIKRSWFVSGLEIETRLVVSGFLEESGVVWMGVLNNGLS